MAPLTRTSAQPLNVITVLVFDLNNKYFFSLLPVAVTVVHVAYR